ncbi:sterol desaturase family protein [Hasllibacter sp. MH4015]|uniref:sterol desaturase family protein n=1 Tax=Hasllibacter sp. MH4015 TaxID=2854029 RepID=UPI001CD3D9C7|nr:sterol desaturase family protein [Hasllibacter sp. MH4015]
MIATVRVLIHMGGLQRLAPFWVAGVVLFAVNFGWLVCVALAYGIVLQFFVEYVLHRFVYHRDPPAEQSPFNALYRAHIGHHEFPNNPEFFTGGDDWFAVKFGVGAVVLHTLVLWPVLGLADAAVFGAVALFLGSVSAFTFYEYCHTLAHLNVPKGWFGRRVTHEHLRHHFNDHDSNYHVSFGMGWIDALFGTVYDRDVAKGRFDRGTVMSLGMDPEDLRLVTARKAYGLPERGSGR